MKLSPINENQQAFSGYVDKSLKKKIKSVARQRCNLIAEVSTLAGKHADFMRVYNEYNWANVLIGRLQSFMKRTNKNTVMYYDKNYPKEPIRVKNKSLQNNIFVSARNIPTLKDNQEAFEPVKKGIFNFKETSAYKKDEQDIKRTIECDIDFNHLFDYCDKLETINPESLDERLLDYANYQLKKEVETTNITLIDQFLFLYRSLKIGKIAKKLKQSNYKNITDDIVVAIERKKRKQNLSKSNFSIVNKIIKRQELENLKEQAQRKTT